MTKRQAILNSLSASERALYERLFNEPCPARGKPAEPEWRKPNTMARVIQECDENEADKRRWKKRKPAAVRVRNAA